MRKRVLTGIQPTNRLHIGNYIGAIKQIQKFDLNEYEVFLFVPDLHALTNEEQSNESISNIMRVYLATCSDKIRYYVQSQHLEIPYFSWLLSCCTPVGQLQRMTQFKSKEHESINSGYLFYPVLMAADIISIDANIIPVGIDQKQHIELTRDIVDYFHNKFKTHNAFVKPEPMICESVKINSLQDPRKKMSKSDPNTYSTLFLDDDPDAIRVKIKKAVTDSENMPIDIASIQDTRPGIYNLCTIYSEISNKTFSQIESTFGGGYISEFKENLIHELNEFLKPLQHKMSEVAQSDIDHILKRDYHFVHEILKNKVNKIDEICKIYKK
jgi:tryptophanyl-tRNA synthetase